MTLALCSGATLPCDAAFLYAIPGVLWALVIPPTVQKQPQVIYTIQAMPFLKRCSNASDSLAGRQW